LDRIIAKIIEVGRALHREGLVDSHSGNISYKFGRYLFITRKNAMLGSIRPSSSHSSPVPQQRKSRTY